VNAFAKRPALVWPGILLCVAAGVVVVGDSYRQAATGKPAETYYALFWLGMLLAVVPVACLILARVTGTVSRLWAIGLLALITAFPKYLRNPTAPLYHDEYAHWHQAQEVLATGHLFRPNNIIPIVQYFPGTSALMASVQRLSGLSTWSAGQLVVLAIHVSSLYAVYILAATHLRSERAAAIAALVYGLNPSALYFDTQYAYESVSIGMFLWTLALGSLAARGRTPGIRRRYLAAALLCSVSCVVTHHLTTLALLGVLLLIALVVTIRARRAAPAATPDPDRAGVWWTLLLGTVGVAALWVGLFARPTIDYLRPYVGSTIGQLTHIAGKGGSGGRQVLAASVEPLWERGFTALAPLSAAVVCLVGVRLLYRRRGTPGALRSSTLAFVGFGLVYFPSVPFILAPSGAEGARRSWAFTYLGVALIFALVATTAPLRVSPPAAVSRFAAPAVQLAIGLGLVVIVLIGNVGASLNDPYRFPGPFLWGSDTRSYTPEAKTVGEMLGAQPGPVRVVTDRYTGLSLAGYGGVDVAQPSTGFPVWQLFEETGAPSPRLVQELVTSDYTYLVVDVRMYQDQAFNGNNFGQDDPQGAGPVPVRFLTALSRQPWAIQVMSTEHLRVFRLDFGALPVAAR
jgi:hypothetical protein